LSVSWHEELLQVWVGRPHQQGVHQSSVTHELICNSRYRRKFIRTGEAKVQALFQTKQPLKTPWSPMLQPDPETCTRIFVPQLSFFSDKEFFLCTCKAYGLPQFSIFPCYQSKEKVCGSVGVSIFPVVLFQNIIYIIIIVLKEKRIFIFHCS